MSYARAQTATILTDSAKDCGQSSHSSCDPTQFNLTCSSWKRKDIRHRQLLPDLLYRKYVKHITLAVASPTLQHLWKGLMAPQGATATQVKETGLEQMEVLTGTGSWGSEWICSMFARQAVLTQGREAGNRNASCRPTFSMLA